MVCRQKKCSECGRPVERGEQLGAADRNGYAQGVIKTVTLIQRRAYRLAERREVLDRLLLVCAGTRACGGRRLHRRKPILNRRSGVNSRPALTLRRVLGGSQLVDGMGATTPHTGDSLRLGDRGTTMSWSKRTRWRGVTREGHASFLTVAARIDSDGHPPWSPA